ncbi:MAG TPA: chain length determinant protein tyrosine kinase EpsG [Methylophilaceae bacterium]|nr:chain length determinant protein tyrosine kinase EpsG [Methylophilaceae bacterium]
MQTVLQSTAQSTTPQSKMSALQRTPASHSIGAILVDAGKLTPEKAESVLRLQKEKHLPFGEAAIKLGLLSPEDVRFALARQYHYSYLLKNNHVVSDELVAAYQPFSPQVESMRALRSQLMLRWFSDEAKNRSLAIVSPGSKEGRSYLAANLAIVFSQLGERTLLIDANMRHPRQHKLFKLENSSGLSSILSGRADANTIQRVASFMDLSVLTAGPIPPNPQELLGRPIFDSLLASASQDYDMIIIDTPPAANCADAHIISMHTGGALIVARQNNSSLRSVHKMADGMAQLGVSLVGTVLTEF